MAAQGFVAKIMCFGGCLTACQFFVIRAKKGRCIALAVFAAIIGTTTVREAEADTLPTLEYAKKTLIYTCAEKCDVKKKNGHMNSNYSCLM